MKGTPMAHPPIDADALYYVRTTCPNCDQTDIVLVRLDAVLTQTRAEGFLSVKSTPKKLEHDCQQGSILGETEVEFEVVEAEIVGPDDTLALPYVDSETGEILGGGEQ